MQKNPHPTADPVTGYFTDGDLVGGIPKSIVGAPIMTTLNEELVRVVEAAGITLDPADNAQLLAAIGFLTANGATRNLLVNGGFDFNQRYGHVLAGGGAAPNISQTPQYVCDRWIMVAGSTSGGCAPSTEEFSPTQTDVPGFPRRYLNYSITSAFTGDGWIAQRVENLRQFNLKTVTFSFWARVDSGTFDGELEFWGWYGTGGSPTAEEQFGSSEAFELTTTWTRKSVTVTLPNVISGKTYGTDEPLADWLEARIVLTESQGTPDVQIANAQLEVSAVPTGFLRPELPVEYRKCQRYLESTGPLDSFPGGGSNNDQNRVLYHDSGGATTAVKTVRDSFQEPKRDTPTVAFGALANNWDVPPPGSIEIGGASVTVTGINDTTRWSTGWPSIASQSIAGLIEYCWGADAELRKPGESLEPLA